jgi:hypothetical protein
MAQAARWMRTHISGGRRLPSAGADLAAAQSAAAVPIVLWMHGLRESAFALIAPQRLAPGSARRWAAWGAMPAVATCRQYGLPAYLQDAAIWLHGRLVASVEAAQVGECALIESSFPGPLAAVPGLEAAFRARVEAQHGWRFDTAWPTAEEARRW